MMTSLDKQEPSDPAPAASLVWDLMFFVTFHFMTKCHEVSLSIKDVQDFIYFLILNHYRYRLQRTNQFHQHQIP